MGRYFSTTRADIANDYMFEPDWNTISAGVQAKQQEYDIALANLELLKNSTLQVQYLNGEGDLKNLQILQDYYGGNADKIAEEIRANGDVAKYMKAIRSLGTELQQDLKSGELSKIQGSALALSNWEKENAKMKEKDPSYYDQARRFFINNYQATGGNSLDNPFSGQLLYDKPDFEKIIAQADKVLANETGWKKDSISGEWITSTGQKVSTVELKRVQARIMGALLADPSNLQYMKQAQQIGFTRYFDDEGNLDYSSPGLIGLNMVAQGTARSSQEFESTVKDNPYGVNTHNSILAEEREIRKEQRANSNSNQIAKLEDEILKRINEGKDATDLQNQLAYLKGENFYIEKDNGREINSIKDFSKISDKNLSDIIQKRVDETAKKMGIEKGDKNYIILENIVDGLKSGKLDPDKFFQENNIREFLLEKALNKVEVKSHGYVRESGKRYYLKNGEVLSEDQLLEKVYKNKNVVDYTKKLYRELDKSITDNKGGDTQIRSYVPVNVVTGNRVAQQIKQFPEYNNQTQVVHDITTGEKKVLKDVGISQVLGVDAKSTQKSLIIRGDNGKRYYLEGDLNNQYISKAAERIFEDGGYNKNNIDAYYLKSSNAGRIAEEVFKMSANGLNIGTTFEVPIQDGVKQKILKIKMEDTGNTFSLPDDKNVSSKMTLDELVRYVDKNLKNYE